MKHLCLCDLHLTSTVRLSAVHCMPVCDVCMLRACGLHKHAACVLSLPVEYSLIELHACLQQTQFDLSTLA